MNITFSEVNNTQTAEIAAVLLYQLGFTPIRDNGKVPVDEGWQKTHYTYENEVRARFKGWKGNVGVLTDGFLLIGNNSQETLDAFRAECPFYDETLCRMGNNPYECAIFRITDPEKWSWKGQKILTNEESPSTLCDLWSAGSQFVAWGVHPVGVRYRFVNDKSILPITTDYARDLILRVAKRLGKWKKLKCKDKKDEKPDKKDESSSSLFKEIKKKVRMSEILNYDRTSRRMRCPLHTQTTDSSAAEIYENPDGDFLYCHSSGCMGDVITIYMHVHGLNRPIEAALELAKKHDIKVDGYSTTAGSADILLNEIIKPNRFGQGKHPKTGKLYYGVPVATHDGKIIPAVFCDGQLIFGEEVLKATGFNFTGDYALVGNTWNRSLLHAYLTKKTAGKSTSELLNELVALSKRFVWHADERVHLIVAAFIMFSYIFTAFGKAPRMVFIGWANSGKSTCTDFIAVYSCNTLLSGDASKAFLFRSVGASAGMVVVDNMEELPDDIKRDMTHIFDISFEENRTVGRVEDSGKGKAPKEFQTFCPMAVNSVDYTWIKTSSRTRAIFILMSTNSGVSLGKLQDESRTSIEKLKHELRIWGIENYDRLTSAAVDVNFTNRDRDIAKPLLAILQDAGKDYFTSGKEFLIKNFDEHHVADEFSEEAVLISTIWNMLWRVYENERKIEIPLIVGDIAVESLHDKGFDDTMFKDKWAALKQKEATRIGNSIQNMPRVRTTTREGKRKYYFNVIDFARFMKVRGYQFDESKEEVEQLLQTTLSNPTQPHQPSPSPSIPHQPQPKEEEADRVREGMRGQRGQNGASEEAAQGGADQIQSVKNALVKSGTLGLSASLIRDQWGQPGINAVNALFERGEARFEAETGCWLAKDKAQPDGGASNA